MLFFVITLYADGSLIYTQSLRIEGKLIHHDNGVINDDDVDYACGGIYTERVEPAQSPKAVVIGAL